MDNNDTDSANLDLNYDENHHLVMPVNIADILKYMPHRYPCLLIDRVVSMQAGKTLTAIKNVTINEPFFNGHFPDYPIMPGVLIVEAMAQAAGMLIFLTNGKQKNEAFFFASIANAKFKRQVIPGDVLEIQVTSLKNLRGMSKYTAKALVKNIIVAEAELMIAKKTL